MSKVALVSGRVLTDGGLREGQAVVIANGRIDAVSPQEDLPPDIDRHDLDGAMLLPGFIDTQVNGGGGVLFNDTPTPEGITAIGAAHRRFGTTGFLPTLISDTLGKVASAREAAEEAISRGVPGVLGLHLEGPFLSPERRGIHDARKIREIDDSGIALLTRPGRGRTVTTLAPERLEPGAIRQLVEAGVIVAAGHTEATAECIFEALDEGLAGFTHLFNAMSPLESRAPGTVGAALYDPRGWCGIIVDGRHVDPIVLKLALRMKPLSRFMLVTDAMPSVGGAKTFPLQGRTIRVENGVCVDEEGTLAGSDLDMASAVRNAMQMLGLGLADAVAMASRNPAEFLGLGHELGRIAPGYRASLVAADDDLSILDTWIDGKRIDG